MTFPLHCFLQTLLCYFEERKTEVPFFSPLGYHLYLFEMIFQIRKRKGKLRKLCLIIIANLILDRHESCSHFHMGTAPAFMDIEGYN